MWAWRHFSDIDECAENPSLCENGRCLNTKGHYRCLCNPGYYVSPDGTQCLGKIHIYSNISDYVVDVSHLRQSWGVNQVLRECASQCVRNAWLIRSWRRNSSKSLTVLMELYCAFGRYILCFLFVLFRFSVSAKLFMRNFCRWKRMWTNKYVQQRKVRQYGRPIQMCL